MADLEHVKDCMEVLLNPGSDINEEALLNNLKLLRNLCSKGRHIQAFLACHEVFHITLEQWLYTIPKNDDKIQKKTQLTAWQVLANIIVNNGVTQAIIWNRFGILIMENCLQKPLGRHTDVQLMIIYNVFKGTSGLLTDEKVIKIIVHLWQNILSEKYEGNLEFLHFLFEYFIVEGGRRTVFCYMHLNSEDRIAFLDYLVNYIRNDSPNGLVHKFLLQHLSKEFKVKSDCVLRQLTENVSELHPREVHTLLRVLACASGSESYEQLFANDHALFLNVSSLLRCLVTAGKETNNIFTPMSKLQEVAPSSTEISHEFEKEVSYEMKTLLVRSIANLLYKNPINQGYCLDTEVMPALFECTNMDAKNPLMKEWSILAIRNACVGCLEIQQVVANLTKKGVAKNDILEELNLEMGSLRIQPNKE